MTYPPAGSSQPSPTLPVSQYLDQYQPPGLSPDGGYVVLPRLLLDQLPPALQQQATQMLSRIHELMAAAEWPVYRVVPSRWDPINELDDAQLRSAGIIAELDARGDLVYRELATGRQLDDSEACNRVLVPARDHSPRPHSSASATSEAR